MPEYGPLQYDESHREAIIVFMRALFLQKPLDEWERALDGLDVCVTPVRTVAEALHDPLFTARDMVSETDGGEIALGVPVKLGATPGRACSAPPGFGEDTDRILKELGYTIEDIEKLRAEDIV